MLGKHLQNDGVLLVETSLVDMVLRWIKIMAPMEIWVQFVAHCLIDNGGSHRIEPHLTSHVLTADLLLDQDLDPHILGHPPGTEGKLWPMEAQAYGDIVDLLIT